MQRNVLGGELIPCSLDPLTGFYRTGCCENHGDDPGMHVVCCRVTREFLEFEAANGNDLSTPAPEFGFAGLVPGDQWCVCAARWAEALAGGRPARWCSSRHTSRRSSSSASTTSAPTPCDGDPGSGRCPAVTVRVACRATGRGPMPAQ